MDKETLSNYGWIVICVLVLSVMIALATPFGSFVSKGVGNTLNGFVDTNDNALYTVARPPIEDPDEKTTITAIGDTFNPQIGKTLYEAIEENWSSDENSKWVYEYGVSNPDISDVFINEDGKVLNLKKTFVERGKQYNSTYYNKTVDVPDDFMKTGNYITTIVDVSDVYGKDSTYYIPIFTKHNGTVTDVLHAVYNGGIYLGEADKVAKLKQETISNYVIAYPSGQDVGCDTSTSHVFQALMDLDGNIVPLDKYVAHLDKYKVVTYFINEKDATFEEAKEQVTQKLLKYIDEQNYGKYSESCHIKLNTPYTLTEDNQTTSYIFFDDGSILCFIKNDKNEITDCACLPKVAKYFENYIKVDDVTLNVSSDGNSLTCDDIEFVAGTTITSGTLLKNTKYVYVEDNTSMSIIIRNNNSIEMYENESLVETIQGTNVDIHEHYICVTLGSDTLYIGIYPDGTAIFINGMMLTKKDS